MMIGPVAGFDWDDGNRAKCQRHGVSIAEIEAPLMGSPRIAPDPTHAVAEERSIVVGRNAGGRPIFVAIAIRIKGGKRLIRPISARYMHAKEIRRYEAEGA